MKEQSSPVLRQPCRNNNIEGHPFSSVSTESMAWWMVHRERLGWCWGSAGRCDHSLLAWAWSCICWPSLTLRLNCVGHTWPFHCLLLLLRVLDSGELPGTSAMQKLTLSSEPSMLQLPCNCKPRASLSAAFLKRRQERRTGTDLTGPALESLPLWHKFFSQHYQMNLSNNFVCAR